MWKAVAATRIVGVEPCYTLVYAALNTPKTIILHARVKCSDNTVNMIKSDT